MGGNIFQLWLISEDWFRRDGAFIFFFFIFFFCQIFTPSSSPFFYSLPFKRG
jgi:hypothetical protein